MKIPVSQITIPARFRSESNDVSDLIESFAEFGQLQPILVSCEPDGKFTLVAGWRRLNAAKQLGWQTIEATTRDELDERTRKVLEYEENICREDFTWQERCVAIAEIHKFRKDQNPTWGLRQTAALLGIRGHSNVAYALQVAEYLQKGDAEVQSQPNLRAALDLLIKRKLTEASNKLMSTRLSSGEVPVKQPEAPEDFEPTGEPVIEARGYRVYRPLKIRLLHLDCIELLKLLKTEGVKVSCIFTDPPYAIDMDNLVQSSTGMGPRLDLVKETHDKDQNIQLIERFVIESFELVADPCWVFLWCDFWVWKTIADIATSVGWRVQRWPLIWAKPDHTFNQMPRSNFTKATECGILLAKGTAVFIKNAPQNFISFPNRKPTNVTNSFWKPPEVHAHFLSALVPSGTTIVDPFCGSGSIAEAAGMLGLDYIGGDIDFTHIANLKHRLNL